MSKRSDLWRQAQVCLSLARATADPALKELYEDMAVDFAHTAAHEPDVSEAEGGLCDGPLSIAERHTESEEIRPSYSRRSV